jgi:hypothetical protein
LHCDRSEVARRWRAGIRPLNGPGLTARATDERELDRAADGRHGLGNAVTSPASRAGAIGIRHRRGARTVSHPTNGDLYRFEQSRTWFPEEKHSSRTGASAEGRKNAAVAASTLDWQQHYRPGITTARRGRNGQHDVANQFHVLSWGKLMGVRGRERDGPFVPTRGTNQGRLGAARDAAMTFLGMLSPLQQAGHVR